MVVYTVQVEFISGIKELILATENGDSAEAEADIHRGRGDCNVYLKEWGNS